MPRQPLLSVDEAVARALAGIEPVASENVPLSQAHDRVLACDLEAQRTQPPHAMSAMDGYAVRHEDTATLPAKLRVVGAAPAGHPFTGAISRGEAVRIFTGGCLPDGADAIVIQENTSLTGDLVQINETVSAGRFVRPKGLDFRAGDVLLHDGRRLGPRDVALAAAMNHAEIPVRRRPRVAVLATGDEIVPPGDPRAHELTVSSNTFGLLAMISRLGGTPIDLGIAADRADAIAAAVSAIDAPDIVVTVGGASVGEHDLVREGLGSLGLEIDFWRIAMRPGKPLMHGSLGRSRFLGLPGNPVSALVCGLIFLKPMVRTLLGEAITSPVASTALLAVPLPANDERQDYLRSRIDVESGKMTVRPFDRQDSSMLSRLQQADCFVIRPPHAQPAEEGSSVPILTIDD